jgi:hypothetical protein
MGLLGNLVNKLYTTILDPFTTIVAHPLQSGKAIIDPNTSFSNLVKKTVSEPKLQQITEVLTTGTVLGSGLGLAKGIATKGLLPVVKNLIPTTGKGKLIGGTTLLVGGGILTQTQKPLTTLSTIPSKLTAFGADVGTFIDQPTLLNAEKILKENPGVSIALGAGAVAAGAGALVTGFGAIENIQTREAVKDLTKELSTQPVSTLLPTSPTETKRVSEIPATSNLSPVSMTPQTPQTQVLSSTAGVRRQKRKSMRSPASISQRVNVIVSNRSIGTQNKTYLKREIYA